MRALAACGHTQVGGGIPADLEAAWQSIVEQQTQMNGGHNVHDVVMEAGAVPPAGDPGRASEHGQDGIPERHVPRTQVQGVTQLATEGRQTTQTSVGGRAALHEDGTNVPVGADDDLLMAPDPGNRGSHSTTAPGSEAIAPSAGRRGETETGGVNIPDREHALVARHSNPLDAIYDALRLETRSETSAWVPLERLQVRLSRVGMSNAMLPPG